MSSRSYTDIFDGWDREVYKPGIFLICGLGSGLKGCLSPLTRNCCYSRRSYVANGVTFWWISGLGNESEIWWWRTFCRANKIWEKKPKTAHPGRPCTQPWKMISRLNFTINETNINLWKMGITWILFYLEYFEKSLSHLPSVGPSQQARSMNLLASD